MQSITQKGQMCYNCFQERESAEGPCPHCGFDLAENEKKYPVALRAGTVLNGRYIIGRVLGQGGFGITYLALDTQLNAKVAIKEFMPGELATRVDGTTVSVLAESKTEAFTYGAERFQEEARTLAKFIGNPNIAAVTSYFDENDTSYFVMDYIEGISFKTYIANHGGRVSVEDTLNVMIPVLRALTAVHQEGFIHRDVTPDNIYITKDGMVKLLDFGSARYSIGDKSKSLDVILKVGYAPKEQYIRRSRQGPFTDVYSCAACFYAALTGFLPPESLERLDNDTLVPVSQCGVDVPEYLDKAILKGLAVQPEDRFQSAAEFLDAIESQQVVEVPGNTPAQSATSPEKKKVRPALIAGIAAAVVVVLGIGYLAGGGGGTTPASGGNPITEALAPKVTIAGQEYSTALTQLFLDDVLVDEADFQNLQEMKNLEYLSYTDGREELDLSFVSGLPNLQMLGAHGYYVDLDLAPLESLKDLTELHIYAEGSNNIARTVDLYPLENLTDLQYIHLDCVPDSYAPLAELKNLQYLSLWNPISGQVDYEYPLSDISPLSGLTELTYLNIPIGDVEDLNSLSGLTKLTDLLLYGNAHTWEDISFLRPLTNLQRLALDNQVLHLQDLSDLSGLTELRELSLNLEDMGSLDGLEYLTQLQELQLSADFAAGAEPDLAPLSGLTALTTLRLHLPYDVSVSLGPLGALTQLRDLQFAGGVQNNDLSPLGGLTSLQSVRVHSDNYQDPFDDLSPFADLANLKSLEIYRVADDIDTSPVAHIPNVNLR